MAKPILGVPVLEGKAAEEFEKYLRNAKPDPKKRERLARDKAFRKKVKVID